MRSLKLEYLGQWHLALEKEADTAPLNSQAPLTAGVQKTCAIKLLTTQNIKINTSLIEPRPPNIDLHPFPGGSYRT